MALVRRNLVLGPNNHVVAAAAVGPAVGRAPIPSQPIPGQPIPGQPFPGQPIPTQPGPQSGPQHAAPQQPGQDEVGAAVAISTGTEPSPSGQAAAVPTEPASLFALVSAFVLVAAGGAGSWALWHFKINAEAIRLPDATTVFAALFAFATAVERLLEPFARFLPGKHTKGELERVVANLANQYDKATLADLIAVAQAKSMVERGRGSRGLVSWGIATAMSTVAASAGGFYLLHSIAGPTWAGIPLWIDAIVTGIVVGSGTKPLHDVISRVQKTKEKGEDVLTGH